MKTPIRNAVIVSDLHCGCQLALCPPGKIRLDEGGTYSQNKIQQKIWEYWRHFWDEVVPAIIKKEPFILVVNGDAIDGVHHNSVTQITHNLTIQKRIAIDVIGGIIKQHKVAAYYHLRGTSSHVGESAQIEEDMASALNAVPNQHGQSAWYKLQLELGKQKLLVDIAHHVGTTGSTAFETTAVMKELVEAYIEAARWGDRPPDAVIRSHRHRCIGIEVPTGRVWGRSYTTPGWQGKTPFAYRVAGARQSNPQFGGLIIREAADGEWYIRPQVYPLHPDAPEKGVVDEEAT